MNLAVMEGVTFGFRDSFEIAKSLGCDIKRTKICGGGARAAVWRKIVANVLNVKVDVIENEQGPGLGGAYLAMVGCGLFRTVKEAADAFVKVVETVEPDPELVKKYDARYEACKELFRAVSPLYS